MYRSRPAAEEVEVKVVDPTKLRFDPSAIAKYKVKGPGTLHHRPHLLLFQCRLVHPPSFILRPSSPSPHILRFKSKSKSKSQNDTDVTTKRGCKSPGVVATCIFSIFCHTSTMSSTAYKRLMLEYRGTQHPPPRGGKIA